METAIVDRLQATGSTSQQRPGQSRCVRRPWLDPSTRSVTAVLERTRAVAHRRREIQCMFGYILRHGGGALHPTEGMRRSRW